MMNDRPDDTIGFHLNADDTSSKGLTGIPQAIHCPATQIKCEVGNDELDRIDIDNLLDTLAAVALSIAARETTN